MPAILPQQRHFIMRNTIKIFTALVFLFSLSACSSTGDNIDNQDEAKLYRDAKGAMKRGEFNRAVQRLESLEARFPFGDYSIQGQLDLMYSYQKAGVPDDVVSTAKRFRRLNPTHPSVDYTYYVQGVAEFDRYKSLLSKWIKRDISKYDQQVLERAFANFYQLTTRFPDSLYAADARQRMIYLKNQLGSACMNVADWDHRRGAYLGAAIRIQECLQRYDGAPALENALEAMNKNFAELGMTDLQVPTAQ